MSSNISGVYAIINTKNKHRYVGSAINLHARLAHHFNALNRGDHCSRHLQHAFNLYGANYFISSILEYCEKEQLIAREQYYIDTLKPSYNMAPAAGSCLGIRRSDETKMRMSKALMGRTYSLETRKKMSISGKNKMHIPLSVESRQKISATLMGNRNGVGYKHTPAARAKISLAKMGNKYNIGSKRTAESRAKMSQIQKGHTVSPEQRIKMSMLNLGKKSSLVTRTKISASITLWWAKRREQTIMSSDIR